MAHVLAVTFCQVQHATTSDVSHKLLWPFRDVLLGDVGHSKPSTLQGQVQMHAETVPEKMRVSFYNGPLSDSAACTRSTVIMDLTEACIAKGYDRQTKTYVTSLTQHDPGAQQADAMLCLQSHAEYASRRMNLGLLAGDTAGESMFLRGQSQRLALAQTQAAGRVSVLANLHLSTFVPMKPDATFAVFARMCAQAVLPLEFFMLFHQVGTVHVPLAYHTDTELADTIIRDRLRQIAQDKAQLEALELRAAAAAAAAAAAPPFPAYKPMAPSAPSAPTAPSAPPACLADADAGDWRACALRAGERVPKRFRALRPSDLAFWASAAP